MAPPSERTGVWGVPDTRAPGAEASYAVTPMICEFWNTVSNAGFFLVAYLALAEGTRRAGAAVVGHAFSSIRIGWFVLHCAIASTAYHATGREALRLWDLGAVALAAIRVVVPNGLRAHPIGWIALALGVLALDEWKRCAADYHSDEKRAREWYNVVAGENAVGRWLAKSRLMGANLHPLWHASAAWAAYGLATDPNLQ